jgi:subtilisin family serine protease
MTADPGRPLGPEALDLLQAIALRGEVARRLESDSALAVLRSVVEATVALFEAEAASIALYDPASDQLVFEVAAGEQGQGVIGVSIRPDQGIAGYVFTSGQALALSDVASDPRFGRTVAERTAYVPRSIVAVPLVDDQGTIGVLEVLDKRSQAAFSLRDIELAAVFARQAAVAIRASRVERDLGSLLRATLRDQAQAATRPLTEAVLDSLVRAGTERLDREDDSRLWALVDRRPDPRQRSRPARAGHRPARGDRSSERARRPCPAARPGRTRAPLDRPLTDDYLPAWSEPFIGDGRARLERLVPIPGLDRERVFGGADGAGITVAIVDSGVERDHPAVGGMLTRSVRVEPGEEDPVVVEDPEAIDVVGHGTACAGIIHSLAPMADIVSVRVLGPDNRGKGTIFAAGLEWAIANGASVINLSLSSKSEALFPVFHEIVDIAYFANVLLVSAANNVPGPSYPSLFSSVVSVAAHDVADPWTWFYNPAPPVEFGAYGVDVDVAWKDGSRIARDRQQLRRAARDVWPRSSDRDTRTRPRSK